jgi:hypothetical protein
MNTMALTNHRMTILINRGNPRPTGRVDRGSHFHGYEHGDVLVKALSIDVKGYDAGVPTLLDECFAALNWVWRPFGNLTEEGLARYHKTFPSLSVGDLVLVDGKAYAVEPTGFKVVLTGIWCEQCGQDADNHERPGVCPRCGHALVPRYGEA